MATDDSDAGSSLAADFTSEEVFESDDFTDFSAGFADSTVLLVVLLLVRDEAPDDAVLVIFDVVEATAEQTCAPCVPAADRVV